MNKITIVGLGAGTIEQMPVGVYRLLKNSGPLFFRTKEHPAAKELAEEGVRFTSFDDVYEKHDEFLKVYEEIAATLIEEAKKRPLVYAVPGHPLVAEATVGRLLALAEKEKVEVEIFGGQSFLDAMLTALEIDPIDGLVILDGTNLKRDDIEVRHHLIICQVYDAFVASEVKLTLMELLPDDYEVTIVKAAGTAKEELKRVPLYELDHEIGLDNLTAVYVPPVKDEALLYQDFKKLREIIRTLRGPNGCPWDKKQTHKSLKRYLIEETYEVLEAIDEEDVDHLIEELGDVLLQVMLHAQIGEDEGLFSIDDVIRLLSEKMIRRHPHVFSTAKVENAEQVLKNWEKIKQEEKQKETSLLDDVPKSLPGLLMAYELQKKAAKVGFDWDDAAPIWLKLQEEMAEFLLELKKGDEDKIKKEFGDLLFVLVNLGRFYNISPEEAIHLTNVKFRKRFRFIEKEAKKRGKNLADMTLEEMDELWELGKKSEEEEDDEVR